MYKAKTRELTLGGMFSAAVAVGTMAVSIPVPATGGFINLGDGIILTVAFLFGGWYAAIAGAVGSALADILLGYAQWAPFSIAIKGLMGYTAVKLFNAQKSPLNIKNLFAVLTAEAIMVIGYYLAGSLMLSSFIVSLEEVPANLAQAAAAACMFIALATGLRKAAGRFS